MASLRYLRRAAARRPRRLGGATHPVHALRPAAPHALVAPGRRRRARRRARQRGGSDGCPRARA